MKFNLELASCNAFFRGCIFWQSYNKLTGEIKKFKIRLTWKHFYEAADLSGYFQQNSHPHQNAIFTNIITFILKIFF